MLRWFVSKVVGVAPEPDRKAEQLLIRAVQRGGPKGQRAYRELVDTHQAWLVNYLTALLGNRADAEDVAQEVLVKAYLAMDRFRAEARLRTWLRRIATNEAYNSRRKRTESLSRTGDLMDVEVHDLGPDAVAARQILLRVLTELPYAYREVLVLRHVEGLDMKQIAVALDVGPSAAKMRLKRARDRFTEVHDAMVEGP